VGAALRCRSKRSRRTITLNEHDFTVIGVAPKDFASPFAGLALDVWTPVMMKDYVARPHFSLTDRGSRWLMVMGRLKRGVTVPQSQRISPQSPITWNRNTRKPTNSWALRFIR